MCPVAEPPRPCEGVSLQFPTAQCRFGCAATNLSGGVKRSEGMAKDMLDD